MSSLQHINVPDPYITSYTDPSTLGWGFTDWNNPTGSRWSADEINNINVFELKAISIEVQTYCKEKNYKHVRVISDSITALSYEIIKGELNQSFVMKFQKSHGCNVHHKICGYQLHTFLEHKMLR